MIGRSGLSDALPHHNVHHIVPDLASEAAVAPVQHHRYAVLRKARELAESVCAAPGVTPTRVKLHKSPFACQTVNAPHDVSFSRKLYDQHMQSWTLMAV